MPPPTTTDAGPDIRPARLAAEQYAQHFADAAPRLTRTQALVEAERCLYCYDAPCATACPTGIDVPSFIKRIADDNLRGAAKAILEANPLGGTCARVCPTEVLCEQVCVRTTQQGKPVEIGKLQRYAVDAVMDQPISALFPRATPTGKTVAVVGAGPAGIACAVGLARLGHSVVLHDAQAKGGGLNEYGLASYKVAGQFAQRELDWLLGIGGITLKTGWKLQTAAQLQALRDGHAAVYLAVGLAGTQALRVPGEDLDGVRDAVDFIAELRQAADPSTLPIGRRVVVIGGGMTAVDAAVQSKLLGAEQVHMVYRRGPATMGASHAEQEWAQTHGISIHHWLVPEALLPGSGAAAGHVAAVRFERQVLMEGQLQPTGLHETLAADMVLKAIGQKLDSSLLADCGLTLRDGRVVADDDGRTGVAGLYAGGDCRLGGRDLTVEAVEDGKRAALAIHSQLIA
ncbi:NAD(P)-dependent oxidoreductase [Pseudaquabacterium pictum]|uniref:dihydrouracil dehydrogenase (NAD(+)) n=1 Tax=Pseudaquabacterium pictum TaxID=2315236 RepID=A0A480ARG3_9BURK|nr:dihydropyrimidine dehydrogenase subunit A [Rubrivivax pictus]